MSLGGARFDDEGARWRDAIKEKDVDAEALGETGSSGPDN